MLSYRVASNKTNNEIEITVRKYKRTIVPGKSTDFRKDVGRSEPRGDSGGSVPVSVLSVSVCLSACVCTCVCAQCCVLAVWVRRSSHRHTSSRWAGRRVTSAHLPRRLATTPSRARTRPRSTQTYTHTHTRTLWAFLHGRRYSFTCRHCKPLIIQDSYSWP